MSKRKILITGANGFVGFHLIEAATKQEFEVFAGIRSNSDVSHLKEVNVTFVELDYSNVANLTAHFEKQRYDYIIHAAGATKAATLNEYNSANAFSTNNLCKALKMVPPKKFVFISSLAALGPARYGKEFKLDPRAPGAPVTSYGKSKLHAEQMLMQHQNIPWMIIRPTAVYGPREKDLLVMIKTINKGIETYIGRKPQLFSFVYVKDLADVVIKACLSELKHEVYNISDGDVYEKYDFSEMTKSILNKKTIKLHVPVVVVKMIAGILETFSRNKTPLLNKEKIAELTASNWNCNIERAEKHLGYSPQYNLREGLMETISWYKENKWI